MNNKEILLLFLYSYPPQKHIKDKDSTQLQSGENVKPKCVGERH